MGKSAAKLLAQKGANVYIVARNVQKLETAIKEISVFDVTIQLLVFMKANTILDSCYTTIFPTLPLHQRQPYTTFRSSQNNI